MLTKIRRFMRGGEKGQGMTEYIIIVCLVAIACLAAVSLFGGNVRALFDRATNSLQQGKSVAATGMNQGTGQSGGTNLTQ